jgi:hypothetical protein
MLNPFTFSYYDILYRLEYHYGRDSSLYKRYRDYINIRNEHYNQEQVNFFVKEHDVTEMTAYPYFLVVDSLIKDAYDNDILFWSKGSLKYYLPFTLKYKKIGEFDSGFLLSHLLPSRYEGFANIAFTDGSCNTINSFPKALLDSSNHKMPYSQTIMSTAYYGSPKQIFDFGEVIYLPYRYISHRQVNTQEVLSDGIILDLIECDNIEYTHMAYVKYYPEFLDLHEQITISSSVHVYKPPVLSDKPKKTCCLVKNKKI